MPRRFLTHLHLLQGLVQGYATDILVADDVPSVFSTPTISNKASNYTVVTADRNKYFVATAGMTFTLPAAAEAEGPFRFIAGFAAVIDVVPATGDTIYLAGTSSTTGFRSVAGVVGPSLELIGIDTTNWITISSTGTWTAIP